MSERHYYKYLDANEDFDGLPPIRKMPRKKQHLKTRWNPRHKATGIPDEIRQQLNDQADTMENIHFTYLASRHERQWIISSLGEFYNQRWLDDVLKLVKGGKEANVYQCLANETSAHLKANFIAAKLYRPRQFRAMKKDHVYSQGRRPLDQDGREIRNSGMLHAMGKRTDYGLDLLQSSWIEHEYEALTRLKEAGCDVPTAYSRGNNVILMEYIGGTDMPAPTLSEMTLEKEEAWFLFKRVLRNIGRMLDNNLVHADLSAYNILYWDGKITLIDFPQVIDPRLNPNAWSIFQRDVRRVCEYFTRQGVRVNPRKIAADFWSAHGFHRGPQTPKELMTEDYDRA